MGTLRLFLVMVDNVVDSSILEVPSRSYGYPFARTNDVIVVRHALLGSRSRTIEKDGLSSITEYFSEFLHFQ